MTNRDNNIDVLEHAIAFLDFECYSNVQDEDLWQHANGKLTPAVRRACTLATPLLSMLACILDPTSAAVLATAFALGSGNHLERREYGRPSRHLDQVHTMHARNLTSSLTQLLACRWIGVTEALLHRHNYNAAFALHNAFSHRAIVSLYSTRLRLPTEAKRLLRILQKLQAHGFDVSDAS